MGILPKNPKFFELFSELASLTEKIGALSVEAVKNFSELTAYAKKARDIEHEADAVTHEIIKLMNSTFVTPIDREDIYALAQHIDDVVDFIENAISNMVLYNVKEPPLQIAEFAETIQTATAEIKKLIDILPHSKYARRMEEYAIELHSLENRGDEIFKNALKNLFANGIEPITVIKWKDIFETLEQVLDACEDVANTVSAIIVKHY